MREDLVASLYAGDYLSDTSHLSAAEHAVLRRLLFRAWIGGPAVFDIDLAPADFTLAEWCSARPAVLPLLLNALHRIADCLEQLRDCTGQRLPAAVWDLVREIIFERDGHACVYCGTQRALQGDHVVPLIRGGSNALTNLATACAACNRAKASRTLVEWQICTVLGQTD